MQTKNLYVMISYGEEPVNEPVFTLDPAWIARQQSLWDSGDLEYDSVGVGGEGFHYTTIQVPEDATYESLGIAKHLILEY